MEIAGLLKAMGTPSWEAAIAMVTAILGGLFYCLRAVVRFVLEWHQQEFDKLSAYLNKPENRAAKLAELQKDSLAQAWFRGAVLFHNKLENSFGKPWSWRQAQVCLAIGLVYPILFFTTSWLFGASGKMVDVIVLPDIDHWLLRLLLVIFLILAWRFYYWMLKYENRQGLLKKLPGAVGRYLSSPYVFAMWILIIWSAVLASIGDGFFPNNTMYPGIGHDNIIIIPDTSIFCSPVIFFGIAAFSNISAYHIIGALLFLFAISLSFIVLGKISAGLLFWCILPVVNTAFDYLSLSVTRVLVGKPADSLRARLEVPVRFVLDLAFAALCLLGLAATLTMAIEATNRYLLIPENAPPVDWQGMLGTAMEDPFGKGIMVTGMVFTTFLPTLVHLFYAFFTLTSAVFRPCAVRTGQLHAAHAQGAWPDDFARDAVARYLALRRYKCIGVASLVAFTLLFALTVALFRFTFYPDLLKEFAYAGARLVAGR